MGGGEDHRLAAWGGAMRLWVVPPSLAAEAATAALFATLVTEQTDVKAAAIGAGGQRKLHADKCTFNSIGPLPNSLS